jgi:Ca2+-binding RTX toxin-like protein
MLDGSKGIDSMTGGLGNDTYLLDNAGDKAMELADQGNDTVKLSTSADLGQPAFANIENAVLMGTGALSATGTAAANALTGNSGANKLTSLGGNDTLDGGGGNDTLVGGLGDDIYVIDKATDVITELSNEGIDTVKSLVSVDLVLAAFANVENATLLGSGAIKAAGSAGDNILIGNAGANQLKGGAGADTMQGGLGNDIYAVGGADDIVNEAGGGGIDTVQSAVTFDLTQNGATVLGDIENLTLLPGAGSIGATGNGLANVLIGNEGNNTLDGRGGADKMTGGLGNDTYVVDDVKDVVTEAANGGTDTVQSAIAFSLAALANIENLTLIGSSDINGTGNGLNNIIIGNDGANLLDGGKGVDSMTGGDGDDVYIVDSAGDVVNEFGSDANDELRTNQALAGILANIEHYTFTGTAAVNFTADGADNKLTGTAKSDTLIGAAGDDTLNGGAGADKLVGGADDDTYVIDNAKDLIDETGGGTDKVLSSVAYQLADGLELLELTGTSATNGTGNAAANLLIGNKGANKLDGKGGADTMEGNGGNDTYVVDDAGDAVTETDKGGTDLVLSAVTFDLSLAGREQIENLTLTGDATNDIDAIGNALANTLSGNAGDNLLDGKGGADKMAGGLGDDTYVVDLAKDKVTEGKDGGTDTVQSVFSYVLGANLENLELLAGAGDIAGTGNTANNRLTGNEGNNTLDGKAGDDTMLGGLGNDTYVIDKAGDVADETDGGGTDTLVTPFATTLGAEFENLTLTGSAAVTGTGNAKDNAILGNSGANVLDAADGQDSVSGGSGNDTLAGGIGSDTLDGGTGADKMTGGGGDDLYRVDSAKDIVVEEPGGGADTVESRITYTLGADVENLTLTGTSAVNGTGNTLDNILVGNTATNILSGGDGDDILDGGKGADKLSGGAGSDTIVRHSLAEGKDTITDFQTGAGGDVLDISDILIGYVDGVSDSDDFVQCVTAGGSTTIKVDADGAADGSKFADVCVLTGVTATLGDLIADGNIALAASA